MRREFEVDRPSGEGGREWGWARREAQLEHLARWLLNQPCEDWVEVENRLLLRGMGDVAGDLRRRIDRLADRAGRREMAD